MREVIVIKDDMYSVKVFWSAEDESFIAVCLMYRTISGLGKTRADAIRELEIAIGLVRESMAEESARQLPD